VRTSIRLGAEDGTSEGTSEGTSDTAWRRRVMTVGAEDGTSEGISDGTSEGKSEAIWRCRVRTSLTVGAEEGKSEGISDGTSEGKSEEAWRCRARTSMTVGTEDGTSEGISDGTSETSWRRRVPSSIPMRASAGRTAREKRKHRTAPRRTTDFMMSGSFGESIGCAAEVESVNSDTANYEGVSRREETARL
jgi:hypothetical protein